jgi:hypothetical protein
LKARSKLQIEVPTTSAVAASLLPKVINIAFVPYDCVFAVGEWIRVGNKLKV